MLYSLIVTCSDKKVNNIMQEKKVIILVLSESFKLARTAKNLTQTELAKLIGCTKQTISDIERGYRPPSAKIVKAMAECTGCSADEILGVEKKGEDENE
jgi:putative transcriptional regulator|nr:MAG: helix-turn-helix domain protein [Bacteriophage sp.]